MEAICIINWDLTSSCLNKMSKWGSENGSVSCWCWWLHKYFMVILGLMHPPVIRGAIFLETPAGVSWGLLIWHHRQTQISAAIPHESPQSPSALWARWRPGSARHLIPNHPHCSLLFYEEPFSCHRSSWSISVATEFLGEWCSALWLALRCRVHTAALITILSRN